MLNICGIVVAILKMETVEIFRCQESIQDVEIKQCGICAALWRPFLKMATGRNFLMSGIKSGHHNQPTYEMSLKSDNVEFVWYCGGHFENGDR